MYFDGVDDYVRVAEPPYVAGARKLTVISWVNPLKFHHDFWSVVSEDWNVDWSIIYGWERLYGRIWFTDGTYVILDLGWRGFTPSTWGYIVFGWDIDAGTVYGFNGWLGRKVSVPVDPSKTPRDIVKVIEIGGRDAMLRGYISQVLIYTRALSDTEIRWNYSNPDNPVRNDLVLRLQAHPDNIKDIDGDGLLEWLDLSGFNNHGKIYGATLVKLIRDPVR